MNLIHRRAALIAAFLVALLSQGKSLAADCGNTRDSYIGTYKGRVTWEVVPPFTQEELSADALLKSLVDRIPHNNYTLTVRFYKEAGDYWADTTVKFDDPTVVNLDPGYMDKSGYVLNLTSEPSKVQFTVTEKRSITLGKKSLDAISVTPKNVKESSRSGSTMSFRETALMEALDCAPGSNVPKKLRQVVTYGRGHKHVRTRELTRVN